MIINNGNLTSLFVAFKAAFQGVLDTAQSQLDLIATRVPSTTGSEEYGWLGQLPMMREWIGDRVVNGIISSGYTIKNKPFELTIGVPRPAIEDDQYGVYTPMFAEMGRSTKTHPDTLGFALLKAGPTTVCYDGQYFFDTDHPVLDANGVAQSQVNWDNNSGSGTAWYLLDTSRALKPIIFQDRKKPQFVAKTALTDDNVFFANEYVYGVDARYNVGYGFWQLAYGSRKTLDETNLVAAWTAMTERTGDNGKALGIRPDLLLVPPSLYMAALKLVSSSTMANGAENIMKGLVKVEMSPWLV
ncbi:MAG: Mu-like prophage major head subunit gpT family protein [Betaproteobacteria bacterium]